ncbi:MAG: hypothetical protein QM844_12910, partial [Planctomycetota bacterium]|nr:hypothetical protein [Planctomycetota bacterium]
VVTARSLGPSDQPTGDSELKLVFSSKMYAIYTQLFLTHIDEKGESSVPVVLSRFTEPERAANIAEFVNAGRDAIRSIAAAFVDDHSYLRATEALRVARWLGDESLAGQIEKDLVTYQRAVESQDAGHRGD